MRRRIGLRKHFVQNPWQIRFGFAQALGARARTRAALVLRRPSLLIRFGSLGNLLRSSGQQFAHIVVASLRKVVVILAYSLKEWRRA